MIKYSGVTIPDISTIYQVLSTDGFELKSSGWIGKESVERAISEAESSGNRIVLIRKTVDVTSEFYR